MMIEAEEMDTLPLDTILVGDALETLRTLPSESVHCIVTSPPYFGLRDYGADGQIGLEPTPDAYVAALVAVFREARRVLRADGTLWLNLGDSYAGSGRGGQSDEKRSANWQPTYANHGLTPVGLKPKDLVGIPWRVAFALQQPYHTGPIKREADRAWLAALIDGEGTIGIKRDKGRSNGGDGECQPGYSVYLSVGNQDRELLDKCVAITGYGKVGLKDRPFVDGRGIQSRREYFGWWISARQAIEVLRDIYPYLVAKRRQAVLAYTLHLSNQGGRALRGNGALPLGEQTWRGHLHEMCKAANQRQEFDMPDRCVEPPPMEEPGWWLRSDIIWAKPSPMPESVTDRPTRSHEYLFLLAKSERYFYDADAIREPHTALGRPPGNHSRIFLDRDPKHHTGASRRPGQEQSFHPNGRNRRSVWQIATRPFNGARLVADYVGRDGKPYKASPDCPIHGHLASHQTPRTGAHDAQPDHPSRHTSGSGDHRAATLSGGRASISLSPNDTSGQENAAQRTRESIGESKTPGQSQTHCADGQGVAAEMTSRTPYSEASPTPLACDMDSLAPSYAPLATDHSSESRRTAHAPVTSPAYTPCAETPDHTGDRSVSPVLIAPDSHTHASSTDAVDSRDHPLEQTPVHSARTSARSPRSSHSSKLPPHSDGSKAKCTCAIVNIDHFATMPPKLVEPCVLAGAPQQTCETCGAPWERVTERVTHFEGGSGRAGRSADEVNAAGKWRNGGEVGNANLKLGPVVESVTTGWRPTCACPAAANTGRGRAVVLDPFMGAGTVGLVARRHSRAFLGIELNPEYQQMALARIARHGAQPDLWSAPLAAEALAQPLPQPVIARLPHVESPIQATAVAARSVAPSLWVECTQEDGL